MNFTRIGRGVPSFCGFLNLCERPISHGCSGTPSVAASPSTRASVSSGRWPGRQGRWGSIQSGLVIRRAFLLMYWSKSWSSLAITDFSSETLCRSASSAIILSLFSWFICSNSWIRSTRASFSNDLNAARTSSFRKDCNRSLVKSESLDLSCFLDSGWFSSRLLMFFLLSLRSLRVPPAIVA